MALIWFSANYYIGEIVTSELETLLFAINSNCALFLNKE